MGLASSVSGVRGEAASSTGKRILRRGQNAAGAATATLIELLGQQQSASVRLKAAHGILAAAAKFEELDNLTLRIETLERAGDRFMTGIGRFSDTRVHKDS